MQRTMFSKPLRDISTIADQALAQTSGGTPPSRPSAFRPESPNREHDGKIATIRAGELFGPKWVKDQLGPPREGTPFYSTRPEPGEPSPTYSSQRQPGEWTL